MEWEKKEKERATQSAEKMSFFVYVENVTVFESVLIKSSNVISHNSHDEIANESFVCNSL